MLASLVEELPIVIWPLVGFKKWHKDADATALERDFGFTPKITLREGLRKFAEWYASFYMSKN